jgi:hypothetical protein
VHRALTLLAALLLNIGAAEAAQAPRDRYSRGDYAAAITAAEAEPTAENLALAARAAVAEANLRESPCLDCLRRAEMLAKRAIETDSRRAESYVLLAVSLGYQARILGRVSVQLAGHASRAKAALATALMLDGSAPQTLAAFGGWHIEVVRMGGALGTAIYGARVETGRDFYRRGIAGDPANLVLRLNYALSLSGYDFDTYRSEIALQLTSAANGMPRNAYETALRTRAVTLRDLLAQDKRTEFLALVNRYQGYPP